MRKAEKMEFEKILKSKMKAKKYKFSRGFFFKVLNDTVFVSGSHIFVPMDETGNFIFWVSVKKYSYDEIFWEIMHMKENSNEPDSLRAFGAFTASGIDILELKTKVVDDFEAFIDELIETTENSIEEFLNLYSINEYVLSHDEIFDAKILQVLAYIDKGMEEEAIKLAKREIELGDTGRFKNEGKGFFELVCEREKKTNPFRNIFSSWRKSRVKK